MSFLFYGDVEMSILRTNRCDRVEIPTDDGADHKWTEWTIDVDCWYNPAAMSYTGNFANVTLTPGLLPAVTDDQIREYLIQPRRKLIYTDDLGNEILRCPADGFFTDVNNGPFVRRCTVNRIHGEKTWHINIILQACVRNCFEFDVPAKNPLIAHRWTQYQDLDEDYFSTITTEGIAVFDGAELLRLGVYPDQYRRDLFFPMPENYKREPLQITAIGDGNALAYRIVDREKPINISSKLFSLGVSRIECYHTTGFSREAAYGPTGQIIRGGLQMGVGVLGLNAQAVATGIENVASGIGRMIPQYSDGVVVNIWGHRGSTRANLTSIAIAVAEARLGPNSGNPGRGIAFHVTHDVMGKFVHLEVRRTWGIDQVIANLGGAVDAAANAIWAGNFDGLVAALGAAVNPANIGINMGPAAIWATINMPGPWDDTTQRDPLLPNSNAGLPIGEPLLGSGDPDHMEVIAGIDSTSPDSDGDLHVWHPPPPNSNMTRGTSVLNIVAQALTGPCEIPAKPPFLTQGSDKIIYE